ncbi:AI-2E family transporter [Novosphingobium lentum]|uniref:AI-2E family transporter n=1 Tax=Novosphingobium lentum TaxID=145287 RepID=UPI00082AC849|nr:AI-2E family transporter [Novosphingobium lentum]
MTIDDTDTLPDSPKPSALSTRAGPSDISDDMVLREAKKAGVWIAMIAAAALLVLLAQPLLVIFGGVVFAAMIDGGARLLGRVLKIGRAWRVAIVLVLTAAFLLWTIYFTGSQIASQAAQFPAVISAQFQRVLAFAQLHGIDVQQFDAKSILENALGGVGPVTRVLGGLFGFVTTVLLILILGIYVAIEPRLYQRGLSWMLPVGEREDFHETLVRMGHSLRRLLAGRLLGMASEGLVTGLLLSFWGVPMAALLGLLTGLLAFLPNIGAPISGTLMILVGFSGGTSMGIFCIVVYLVVQTVDGNIIVPMVARKTVDLAPALVLGAQLIMGVLFGILGLALADPIVAMLKIALERRSERNAATIAEAQG